MLFGLAQSLRSLTASPLASLAKEAHRIARRRLEARGSVVPRGGANDQRDMDDFELPGDLDANELKIIVALVHRLKRNVQAAFGASRGCRMRSWSRRRAWDCSCVH